MYFKSMIYREYCTILRIVRKGHTYKKWMCWLMDKFDPNYLSMICSLYMNIPILWMFIKKGKHETLSI